MNNLPEGSVRMNEKFFDLKKEKQDRIINAAITVFAKYGYRHASTDDIVAAAGISKGLLFHYFISKSGLYDFIFNYSVRYMTLEISREVKKEETDFFTLFYQIESAKIKVLRNYPNMQRFLNRVQYEESTEALEAVAEKKNLLDTMFYEIMDKADYSVFDEQFDRSRFIKLLRFAADAIMTECYLTGSIQPDMLLLELAAYLDMMKSLAKQGAESNSITE